LTQYSLQPQQPNTLKIDDIAVKNFLTVTDWFYRGGQPDNAALEQLVKSGFRTVISLRWNMDIIKAEKALAKQHGLNFYSIPLSYWILPSRKEIDFFLSILDDKSKHPIFMHCLHGQDRTGMLTAIYRMAREGWTADDAYTEMKAKGFRHIRMHQFKWAVYGFERRLNRDRKQNF
jgi:protein tyrosine/serine phosphatase